MKINPPQKANVRKRVLYGWLPTWEKATVGCRVRAVLRGGSLQSKLKSPRFEVFTFSSTCCLQCISIEKDFLWFSESLSPVQMLVAASGTNVPQSTIKCKLKIHNSIQICYCWKNTFYCKIEINSNFISWYNNYSNYWQFHIYELSFHPKHNYVSSFS